MEVVSLCPLRVASLLWRTKPRDWSQTVICKATFDLLPGESRLSDRQEDVKEHDEHYSDDAARSLYLPTDMAPFKSRADITLVGHAYVEGGRLARSVVTRLVVGEVDKSLEVHLDRWWSQDGVLCEGARFTKMPLRYERAGGGPESWNPVGIPADAVADMYGKVAAPNLQEPGVVLSEPGAAREPIGYGAIAPHWPWRRGLVHIDWSPARLASEPLPAEVEPGFFNVAPPDQQCSAIRGNERIVLENLLSEHSKLATNLPGLAPRAFRETPAGPEEIALACDTLWIDTDRGICTLVWRGQVSLSRPDEAGRIVVGLSNEGERLEYADFVARQADWTTKKAAANSKPSDSDADSVPMTARDADSEPPLVSTSRAPATSPVPPESTTSPGGPAPSGETSGARHLPFLPASTPRAPASRASSSRPILRPPSRAPSRAPASGVGMATTRRAQPSGGAVVQPAAHTEVTPSVPAAVAAPKAASPAAAAAPKAPSPAAAAAAAWASANSARGAGSGEVIDLLWVALDGMRRAREKDEWKSIVEALSAEKTDILFDSETPPDLAQEGLDHKDCFGILTRGEVIDGDGVLEAMSAAVGPDGSFTPPLVLIQGSLQFAFDEIEMLKAMVTAIKPVLSGDARLQGVVEGIEGLLNTPWLQSAGTVAEGQIQRLRDAFAQSSSRKVSPSYLEQHAERVLLEDRHYQRRTVYGSSCLRAMLAPLGASDAIPTYLPENLAKHLPMFTKLNVRMICEVTGPQDQYEKHSAALRPVALGRILPVVRR